MWLLQLGWYVRKWVHGDRNCCAHQRSDGRSHARSLAETENTLRVSRSHFEVSDICARRVRR